LDVRCGTDIIDIRRIENAIKSNGRFAGKIYTDLEIDYCESKRAGKYQSYAARFAAKEAFYKAIGAGLFAGPALTDVEVYNDETSGEPSLRLYGRAADAFRLKGGSGLSVSLSHTADMALAMVVILYEC